MITPPGYYFSRRLVTTRLNVNRKVTGLARAVFYLDHDNSIWNPADPHHSLRGPARAEFTRRPDGTVTLRWARMDTFLDEE